MNSELQDDLRQLEAIKAQARDVTAGLSQAQFNWQPEPGRWSIAECFAHMNNATTKTLPSFDRAIAEGRARGHVGNEPGRYGWFARWMIGSMEPPPKRRMKTFKIFLPGENKERRVAETLSEYIQVRDQLADRVRQADGLNLNRNRVISPVTSLLRLPLGAYFVFVIAHDRRHLWQARQVRTASAFPRV